MFKNFIISALRNLKKQKTTAAINIIGLAIGIAVILFIFLFIDYELGFDSHIQNSDRLYRVVLHGQRPSGVEYSGSNYFPLSNALRNDFPELPAVTQTNQIIDVPFTFDDKKLNVKLALFVEPEFYDIMQPIWIIEDMNKGTDPSSVILTESLSNKIFGNLNSVGKHLKLNDAIELTVTGIIADPPKQTSLPYEMLISWGAMKNLYSQNNLTRWNYISGTSQTFLILPEQYTLSGFEAMLETFKLKYLDKEDQEIISFHLQPFNDIHLNTNYESYTYITSRRTLLALGAIGFLILLIACINFINLTTARALRRVREMGIRKVLGADKKILMQQILSEIFYLYYYFSDSGIYSIFNDPF